MDDESITGAFIYPSNYILITHAQDEDRAVISFFQRMSIKASSNRHKGR